MLRHRRQPSLWTRTPTLWLAGTAALVVGAALYKFFPEVHRYVRMRRM